MRTMAHLALLLAFAASFACASDVPVGISYDPLERFPAQASWRWDDLRNLLPEDERVEARNLGPLVKEIVAAELTARGYREARSTGPDYLISFQLQMNSRIRPEGSFVIGSLSLLLRDAESGRRVWVGFAQAEANLSRTEEERRARLTRIVQRMLRNFPPQPE